MSSTNEAPEQSGYSWQQSPVLWKLTIAYTALSIWISGWASGRFGPAQSLGLAIVLLLPALFAWRNLILGREFKRRDCIYLGFVILLALCVSQLLVSMWHEYRLDRAAMFEREYQRFRRLVVSMPQYKDVEVSYTHRKGGRVYLQGSVQTKGAHDLLIQKFEGLVRNNEAGYLDDVEYPGKPQRDSHSEAAGE